MENTRKRVTNVMPFNPPGSGSIGSLLVLSAHHLCTRYHAVAAFAFCLEHAVIG